MAKEWYLMTKNKRYSGFENDLFADQAQEGFEEITETFIGKSFELYSSDLSQMKIINGIVQKNVENTSYSSMFREFLLPIGSCKAGMYIKYRNVFWLITNFVDDNLMYEKALGTLCQYYLKWQNQQGEIVGRWVNIISNAQYNSGITTSSKGANIILQSDQLMLTAPFDNEVLSLNDQKRLMISYKKNSHSVYEITRLDSVPYAFGDNGTVQIIVTQTPEQTNNDNFELGICDYIPQNDISNKPNNKSDITPTIQYSSLFVKVGTSGSKFFGVFENENGEKLSDIIPKWEIQSNFKEELCITCSENYINIKTYNENLIGEKIKLILHPENNENLVTELVITITSIF